MSEEEGPDEEMQEFWLILAGMAVAAVITMALLLFLVPGWLAEPLP